jgi:hypothetical protein
MISPPGSLWLRRIYGVQTGFLLTSDVVVMVVMARPVLPASQPKAPFGRNQHSLSRFSEALEQGLALNIQFGKTLLGCHQRGVPEQVPQICEFAGENSIVPDCSLDARGTVRRRMTVARKMKTAAQAGEVSETNFQVARAPNTTGATVLNNLIEQRHRNQIVNDAAV